MTCFSHVLLGSYSTRAPEVDEWGDNCNVTHCFDCHLLCNKSWLRYMKKYLSLFSYFIMMIFDGFSPLQWKCPRFSFQKSGQLSFKSLWLLTCKLRFKMNSSGSGFPTTKSSCSDIGSLILTNHDSRHDQQQGGNEGRCAHRQTERQVGERRLRSRQGHLCTRRGNNSVIQLLSSPAEY